jgi:o-succinylbenzoate synthase
VRIDVIELVVLELGLGPIEGALGVFDRRPLVLVHVLNDEGDGWGECGALAEAAGGDPAALTVEHRLESVGIPRLVTAVGARGGALDASVVPQLFSSRAEDRMMAATLEMALVDLELRSSGVSLSSSLGVAREQVEVGALAGIPADRELGTLIAVVAAAVEAGARRVRVKIAPGWDVEPLCALRSRFADLAIQADANGAYRLDHESGPIGRTDDARRLAALDDLALTCIEQPLPAADLAAHVELRALIATPIALDESLASARHVEQALRYGACEVACLKPARLGGLLAARRAHDLCLAAGVPAFVGGLFEAGLARGANAALAGLPGFTLPGDLSAPASYLSVDPFGYPPVVDGLVTLWAEPGVGPPPEPGVLESCRVRTRRFSAR